MPAQNELTVLDKEIQRIKRLREDVLLMRFYMARREDIKERISDRDRLITEAALKSSLEVLEWHEEGKPPRLEEEEKEEKSPTEFVASVASALMYSVDVLVAAASVSIERDAADGQALYVTPESLRASLAAPDIAAALGEAEPSEWKWRRKTAAEAEKYILGRISWTAIFFLLAVCFHLLTTHRFYLLSIENGELGGFLLYLMNPKDKWTMAIFVSAFIWALVGSHIWILIRFRKFSAAYTFDPARADIIQARVYSGSITTAVLLYFVFAGADPLVGHWKVNLPLWAFVLGYAGKLQVELLRVFVDRIGNTIRGFSPTPRDTKTSDKSDKKKTRPPVGPVPDGKGLPKPKTVKKPQEGGTPGGHSE